MTSAGVKLLEECEAAGVGVSLSDTPGRLSLKWPNPEAARTFRVKLLELRPEVLEALTWERCQRCHRRARRLLPAYWGEELCSWCVGLSVLEFDLKGTWPPEPPEWGPSPKPRAFHLARSVTVADRLRPTRRSSPPRFAPRPGPPLAGPLRSEGSEHCPACRAHPWATERLCGPHRSAWARGVEAARRAREVAA